MGDYFRKCYHLRALQCIITFIKILGNPFDVFKKIYAAPNSLTIEAFFNVNKAYQSTSIL